MNKKLNMYERVCDRKLQLEIQLNNLNRELTQLMGGPQDVKAVDYSKIISGSAVTTTDYVLIENKIAELSAVKQELEEVKEIKKAIELEFISSNKLTKTEKLIFSVRGRKLKDGRYLWTSTQLSNFTGLNSTYIRFLQKAIDVKMEDFIKGKNENFLNKI